jgi:hypothetical protein
MKDPSYLSAYEDGTVCSETSAYKIHMPGNYQEDIIQHSKHGESLKSRIFIIKHIYRQSEQKQHTHDTSVK